MNGHVYLLHFSTPYKHAKHYLGWTEDVERRLLEHRAGSGARLTQVVVRAGISLYLAATWPGGKDLERAYKLWHSGVKLCPICKAGETNERNRLKRAPGTR